MLVTIRWQIWRIQKFPFLYKGSGRGEYEVLDYRINVDFIANYRRTVDVFHVITDFRLRHVVQSPNTDQNLPKSPFHRHKKLSNNVLSYASPLMGEGFILLTRGYGSMGGGRTILRWTVFDNFFGGETVI